MDLTPLLGATNNDIISLTGVVPVLQPFLHWLDGDGGTSDENEEN